MTQSAQRAVSVVPSTAPSNITSRLRALSERPRALPVFDLIERYMRQYAGRDITRGQRLSAWQRLIGEFELEQVDSDLLHAARSELAAAPPLFFAGTDHAGEQIFKVKRSTKVRSGASVNRYFQALSAVFTWGLDQRLTPKGWLNPCRGIKRMPESNGRVRFLDEAERTRLFDACKASKYPRLYPLALTAMKTGARRGELLALTWHDVDLDKGLAMLGRTKNGDRRTLVLLPDVIEALRPFKSSDPTRFVFGSVRSKYQKPAVIDSAWRDAVARAKVRDFRFHDLRHCCASYLAQAGVPLHVIAEVLGHRKLDMARRYSHLTTQTKASAMLHALGNI